MTFEKWWKEQPDEPRAGQTYSYNALKSLANHAWNAAFEWQRVAEGKPEHGKIVLICIVTEQLKRQIPLRAVWYDRFTEEDNYNENEATEYCEDKDAYFVCEGWYEFNQCDEVNWAITDTVTHWAEIPLPPVE
jgi:hypothetical protein